MLIADSVKLFLIGLITLAFMVLVFAFMMDDEIAMATCMKGHGYDACHYSLHR